MKSPEYKKVLMNSPFGYSFNKIVVDNSGTPVDFIFIEVNSAFEAITGLKKQDIVNKKAKDIIPDSAGNKTDWIDFFGEIALSSSEEIVEKYAGTPEKMYKINSYSPEVNYFIIYITEYTDKVDKHIISKESKSQSTAIENELRKSRNLLDLFFSQSLDGFFFMMLDKPVEWNDSVDKDKVLDYVFMHQRITKINDAMLDQYQAKKDDFIGHTPNDFFKHNIEYGKSVWKNFFDEGKLHIDTEEKKFDGTAMVIEGDYICIHDDEGRITGHFGVQREVTQEREAKNKIEETNRKLDFLLSESPAVIYSYEITDGKPVISFVSHNVKTVLGYEPDIFINSFDAWVSKIHPEDLDAILEVNKKLKKHGNIKHDYRFMNSEGQYCWIHDELHLVESSSGSQAGPGSVTVIGSLIDITDRKNIEHELLELNRFNKLILDNSPFGIVVYNRYGNAVMANNASVDILGAPDRESILSQNYREIVPWKNNNLIEAADNVFENKTSVRMSVNLESSFGNFLWLEVIMAALEIGNVPHLMVIFRDVTEQYLAHRALKESEEKFRQMAENIDETFWLRTADRMLYISPGYETIWGRSTQSLYENPDSFLDSVHPDDKDTVTGEFNNSMGSFNIEYRIIRPEGDTRWVWARSFTVKGEEGTDSRIAGIAADITQKKLLEAKLKEISIRDPLTNSYNRRYIYERLQSNLDQSLRDNSIFSIAIIDLDNFKIINDTYGHLAGDYILKEFSLQIGSHIRPYDLCGRFGGEEFIVVLAGIGREKSFSTIERILDTVRKRTYHFENHKIKMTFSCGIADTSETGKKDMSIEKIISIADERLYTAKQSGRNRIIV